MHSFDVQEEFLLDGEPFKIMGGAIHYFRVHPSDWEHSLYNLKALGFNTVETYIPWNLHEPKPGAFDFEGGKDVAAFLDKAAELGLWAIVRPSPFICAEWEFGGMPAWLLTDRSMRPRSNDPKFLAHVASYYDALFPQLVERQITCGGNIIMMQVENEYGSYCEDKGYVRAIRDLMLKRGVDVPLCTSDGPWRACLRAGSLAEDGILPTGNFGSRAAENFAALKKFHAEHGRTWPLMCMEFWDGWFNRWGEDIVKRDTDDLERSVREALELGSVNLYMFHGGTNFGFMNGCSARGTHDLHQVTSYDYGAPLDEAGNPTDKYFAIRRVVRELMPDAEQAEPRVKGALSERELAFTGKCGLFETLGTLAKPQRTFYPVPMEDLGQAYGYTLYRATVEADAKEERYRVVDARDRAQLFLNGELVATQYQEEIGSDIYAHPRSGENRLDVLVENMGRVNYGHKLLADTQHKGIRTGVAVDLHFVTGWDTYCLPFDSTDGVDFASGWREGEPGFYRFALTVGADELGLDTYLDLHGFGKGVVWVNGFNVGRYWQKGPIRTLYVPHGLLHEGQNDVVVFDSEGISCEALSVREEPVIEEQAGEEQK